MSRKPVISKADEEGVTDSEDTAECSNREKMFRIAYETRNMELRLFWERANYFLALNTAIALGFFTIDSEQFYSRLFLSVIGVVVGVLWVLTNLGSKFWQARWESRLKSAEIELSPTIKLFSETWEKMESDAKEEVEGRRKSKIDKVVNWGILKKPSVTRTMIALSVWSVVFWVAAIIGVIIFRERPDTGVFGPV